MANKGVENIAAALLALGYTPEMLQERTTQNLQAKAVPMAKGGTTRNSLPRPQLSQTTIAGGPKDPNKKTMTPMEQAKQDPRVIQAVALARARLGQSGRSPMENSQGTGMQSFGFGGGGESGGPGSDVANRPEGGWSSAGPEILNEPTVVSGDTGIVPLMNEAEPGAGRGASVKSEDFRAAVMSLPKTLREQFVANFIDMGFHMMKGGGATMAGPAAGNKMGTGRGPMPIEPLGTGRGPSPTNQQTNSVQQSSTVQQGQMPNFNQMGQDIRNQVQQKISGSMQGAMKKFPRMGIASEYGQPEMKLPVFFEEGGVTEMDPDGMLEEEDEEYKKAYQLMRQQLGRDLTEEEKAAAREGVERVRSGTNGQAGNNGIPTFGDDAGVRQGGPSAINPEEIQQSQIASEPQKPQSDDPAAVNDPTAGVTYKGKGDWRFDPYSGKWVPLAGSVPAGAGVTTGKDNDLMSQSQAMRSAEGTNAQPVDMNDPEVFNSIAAVDLFGGASNAAMAHWMKTMDPRYRADLDIDIKAGGPGAIQNAGQYKSQQQLDALSEYTRPEMNTEEDGLAVINGQVTGRVPGRNSPERVAELQSTIGGSSGSGVPGTSFTGGGRSGNNSGGSGGTSSGGSGSGSGQLPSGYQIDPETGKAVFIGDNEDATEDNDFLTINGERVLVKDLRAYLADLDAGATPFRDAEKRRIQGVQSGSIPQTVTDPEKLAALELPANIFGKWVTSDQTGNEFKIDKAEDGTYTLSYRGIEGGPDRIAKQTKDFNDMKISYALLMSGKNPTMENNPEAQARIPQNLRETLELTRGVEQEGRGALAGYDDPEASKERYRKNVVDKDPAARVALANALHESGELPLPTREEALKDLTLPKEAFFEYDVETGEPIKLKEDWTYDQSTGIISARDPEDGRKYRFDEATGIATLLRPDGTPFDVPAEQIPAGQEAETTEEVPTEAGSTVEDMDPDEVVESAEESVVLFGDVTGVPRGTMPTGTRGDVEVFEGSDGSWYWKDPATGQVYRFKTPPQVG